MTDTEIVQKINRQEFRANWGGLIAGVTVCIMALFATVFIVVTGSNFKQTFIFMLSWVIVFLMITIIASIKRDFFFEKFKRNLIIFFESFFSGFWRTLSVFCVLCWVAMLFMVLPPH